MDYLTQTGRDESKIKVIKEYLQKAKLMQDYKAANKISYSQVFF